MSERTETIEALKKLGLDENCDYFVESIFQVETYFEARAVNIVTETDYENKNYDAWGVAQLDNELHKETRIIGFQLLDKDCKKTTFEELTKGLRSDIPNGKNNCAICGVALKKSRNSGTDRRELDGGLRCFDHIGLEVAQ